MDKQYGFELTGVSPFIMHWDNLEGADILEAWQKDPKNKGQSKPGDDRTPPWTWKHYVYNDGTHIALPSDVIGKCLLGGAARVPLKGNVTFKARSQSGILLLEPYVEFLNNGKHVAMADIEAIDGAVYADHRAAAAALGFELFAKRAKIGQSKHVRVRPRFANWSVNGVVLVIDPLITAEILRLIFSEAGAYVGMGDWRPSSPKSPGPWGRFKASVKELK